MANGDYWNVGAGTPLNRRRGSASRDAIDRIIELTSNLSRMNQDKKDRKVYRFDEYINRISEGFQNLTDNELIRSIQDKVDTYYQNSGGSGNFEMSQIKDAFDFRVNAAIGENEQYEFAKEGFTRTINAGEDFIDKAFTFDDSDFAGQRKIIREDKLYHDLKSEGNLEYIPKEYKGDEIKEYRYYLANQFKKHVRDEFGSQYQNFFSRFGSRINSQDPNLNDDLRDSQYYLGAVLTAFQSDGIFSKQEYEALKGAIDNADATQYKNEMHALTLANSDKVRTLQNNFGNYSNEYKKLKTRYKLGKDSLSPEYIAGFYKDGVMKGGSYIPLQTEGDVQVPWRQILEVEEQHSKYEAGKGKKPTLPRPSSVELKIAKEIHADWVIKEHDLKGNLISTNEQLEGYGVLNMFSANSLTFMGDKSEEEKAKADMKQDILDETYKEKKNRMPVAEIENTEENSKYEMIVNADLDTLDWAKSVSDKGGDLSEEVLGQMVKAIRQLRFNHGDKWPIYYYQRNLHKRFGNLPMNEKEYANKLINNKLKEFNVGN